MMTEFTPYASLFGGVLIGLAAVILMAFIGRIAGMTAMIDGGLAPWPTALFLISMGAGIALARFLQAMPRRRTA